MIDKDKAKEAILKVKETLDKMPENSPFKLVRKGL